MKVYIAGPVAGIPDNNKPAFDDAAGIWRAFGETQKPESVTEHLLTYGCPVGGTVLDLFAGSGTTGMVAKHTGRKAVLYEMRESQCEQAARRLAQDVLDLFGGE